MEIINTIIVFLSILLTMLWSASIRKKAKLGERAHQGNINSTFLFFISLLVVLIFGLSPLHLLWLFPVSALVGQFYEIFPLFLICFPALYFEKLLYIGINVRERYEMKRDTDEILNSVGEKKITKEEGFQKLLNKMREKK